MYPVQMDVVKTEQERLRFVRREMERIISEPTSPMSMMLFAMLKEDIIHGLLYMASLN
jgi:hypothetical protein